MKEAFTRLYRGVVLLTIVGLSYCNFLQYREVQRITASHQQIEAEVSALGISLEKMSATLDTLVETHPYIHQKKRWDKKESRCIDGSFFGFLLYKGVDTNVSVELTAALASYKGPEALITSLRRSYNPSSQHYCGKAVDLDWNEDVIKFLVSEEGLQWLTEHNIRFYIEGKPGSKRVAKYLGDQRTAKYVFFNANATGDHLHLNV